jgi:ABC-type cobalt transport system substrate-binding protein
MNYVNLTPHAINLNDGRRFSASGQVARVQASYTPFADDICRQVFGEVENLPAPQEGVRYIVSGMVLGAVVNRDDVVAPATGHPDTVRNEQGHIISVPGFVR